MSFNNNEELTSKSEEFCNALAEPERVCLVNKMSGKEVSECDLIEASCLPSRDVRNHMRVLSLAGAVTEQKKGECTYYTPSDKASIAATQKSCISQDGKPVSTSPARATQDIDAAIGKGKAAYMHEAEALFRRGV